MEQVFKTKWVPDWQYVGMGGRHIGRDCCLFLAAGMDGFGWFNCTSHAVLFSVEDYLYD